MSSEAENTDPDLEKSAAEENPAGRDFCNGCDRRCCSRPVVLPEERENIILKTGMGFLQRRRIFEKHGDYHIIRGEVCPFLKEGQCSIEDVRPLNCRIFPLALNNQEKDAEWTLSPECPSFHKVPYEFIEQAKKLGQPLLEKHMEKGPLI